VQSFVALRIGSGFAEYAPRACLSFQDGRRSLIRDFVDFAKIKHGSNPPRRERPLAKGVSTY
jgi:hypothetical protein